MGDFYGTGIEIWAGFGPVGTTEKKEIWADYEQFFGPGFSNFHGDKQQQQNKNIAPQYWFEPEKS